MIQLITYSVVVGLCQMSAASAVQGPTTVPSTPFCYSFNGTLCDEAKRNASISTKDRNWLCSARVVACMPESDQHSSCITIWKQRANDTLPEHTDKRLESTIYMSCLSMVSMAQTNCGYGCVAGRSGRIINGTSLVNCCCKEAFCNHHELRLLNISVIGSNDVGGKTPRAGTVPATSHVSTGLIIAAVIGALGTVGVLLFVHFMRQKHRQYKPCANEHLLEESDTLGAFESVLSLQTEIAQGRYAKVYQGGAINGVPVAIKCFTAAHRRMWQQEKDIYRTPGMASSSNITRFFGATQKGAGNDLTMWIVVQYYPNGSIYDYLKGHTLTWPVMLKLAHSMMKGLAYLHDELTQPDGQRRSLAHRDIKSKNILIKDDMTAAIADFGLAQYFKDGNVNESHAQFQAGTHRYMAPEVLDGAISFSKDSFLRIDVYAAALVMWELITRCDVSGHRSTEYKAPYEDMETGTYSSLLETLQVTVSKQRKRPSFPECLYRNTHAASYINTVEESWDSDAEARLSAGCIEARLDALLIASVTDNTELNNMRNLDPPSYSPRDVADESSLFITYT